MKISVTHSTVYRYDFPVFLEPHIFRLRPRTNSAQRLLAFDIQISPTPAGTTECLDQDGNLALNAWFNAPTRELSVISRLHGGDASSKSVRLCDHRRIAESSLWYREPLCSGPDALPQRLARGRIGEAICEVDGRRRAMEHALISGGIKPANLSKLPSGDPPPRAALAFGPDVEFAGGVLPRSGGFVLRCLPGDGNRRPVCQRI